MLILFERNFMNLFKKIKIIILVGIVLFPLNSIYAQSTNDIISNIKNENPHDFYKRVIAPYKGDLEIWYQNNRSFLNDFFLIIFTAWVIFFPKSKLYFKFFKYLPKRNF